MRIRSDGRIDSSWSGPGPSPLGPSDTGLQVDSLLCNTTLMSRRCVMATIYLADQFLLLEIEGTFEQIEPFLEFEEPEMFDADETESRLGDAARWSYRIPCPGVRYYFFE